MFALELCYLCGSFALIISCRKGYGRVSKYNSNDPILPLLNVQTGIVQQCYAHNNCSAMMQRQANCAQEKEKLAYV